MAGRGHSLRWAMAAMVAAVQVGPAATVWAEVPPPLPPLISPEAQKAIDKGLAYLARTQSRDGAWRHAGNHGQYPVAMTALAGVALLANGNTATQGRYAPNVSRATTFILRSAGPEGLIAHPDEASRSMYGHGFSMLFLGELYGMEDDPARQEQIGGVLRRAAALTARSQSKAGGWLYTPNSSGDEGSVTVTQLQGLRACRNAGVAIPKTGIGHDSPSVIDNALKYLEKSARPDGGISYRANDGGSSRPPITAAAVACWYNAGEYDNPLAKKALEYVKKRIGTGGSGRHGSWGHFYYAHLYMSQVMWLSGEEDWKWYFPPMRDWMIEQQAADGSWDGDGVGTTYGTAIALVILQMPYGYLPILQR